MTGGGSGIGRAICLRLAHEGSKVAIIDRDAQGAAETVDQIAALGRQALPIEADISDHRWSRTRQTRFSTTPDAAT